MPPTNAEIIFYICALIGGFGWFVWALRRDAHLHHDDDPYRYCPREDEDY